MCFPEICCIEILLYIACYLSHVMDVWKSNLFCPFYILDPMFSYFHVYFFSISEYQQLIRKGPYNHQFTVQHFHGTNPVVYSVTGWLRYSREHASARQISNLLQESQK